MTTTQFSFDSKIFEVPKKVCPKISQCPLVSIVLTAYKRPQQLHKTLRSIWQQSYKNLEIIVVEDGHDGGKTEFLSKAYGCTYICRNDRPDRPYSNVSVPINMGINAANGEIIILQGAECMYTDSDSVEKLINPIIEDAAVSTSACIQALDKYGKEEGWSHNGFTHPHCFLNFCQAIATHNVQSIGGFDETFVDWGLEDNDFEFRLQYSGVKCIYVDVKVLHQWHEPAIKNEKDCERAAEYYRAKLQGIEQGTVSLMANL